MTDYRLHKKDVEDILPLTNNQKNILNLHLLYKDSTLFNETNVYNIQGEISLDCVEKAWNWLAEACSVFRVVFRWQRLREPIQIVLKSKKLECHMMAPDEDVDILCRRLLAQPFDLQVNALRVYLGYDHSGCASMVISNHHILYDGWGNARMLVLLQHACRYYAGLQNNLPYVYPYSLGVREMARAGQAKANDEFWNMYFSGWKRVVQENPVEPCYKKSKVVTFTQELLECIDKCVATTRVSSTVIYYFAWLVRDVVESGDTYCYFATTFSGRDASTIGARVGIQFSINTLPFFLKFNRSDTVMEVMESIQRILLQLQERQRDDMMSICKQLDYTLPEHYPSVFVVQNYPIDDALRQSGPYGISIKKRYYKTISDLNASIQCFEQTSIDIEYNEYRYSSEKIDSYLHRFQMTLQLCNLFLNKSMDTFLEHLSSSHIGSDEEIGEFVL